MDPTKMDAGNNATGPVHTSALRVLQRADAV